MKRRKKKSEVLTIRIDKSISSLTASDSHKYITEVGTISLLYPCFATMQRYEIFCTEGDLFFDIERYNTLEEAEERIYEILEVKRLEREEKLNKLNIK